MEAENSFHSAHGTMKVNQRFKLQKVFLILCSTKDYIRLSFRHNDVGHMSLKAIMCILREYHQSSAKVWHQHFENMQTFCNNLDQFLLFTFPTSYGGKNLYRLKHEDWILDCKPYLTRAVAKSTAVENNRPCTDAQATQPQSKPVEIDVGLKLCFCDKMNNRTEEKVIGKSFDPEKQQIDNLKTYGGYCCYHFKKGARYAICNACN